MERRETLEMLMQALEVVGAQSAEVSSNGELIARALGTDLDTAFAVTQALVHTMRDMYGWDHPAKTVASTFLMGLTVGKHLGVEEGRKLPHVEI